MKYFILPILILFFTILDLSAQSFDLNTSNSEIITVLFGGKWDNDIKRCIWLPINEEEKKFFNNIGGGMKDSDVLYTQQWVEYNYPKNGIERRIILTETGRYPINEGGAGCHACGIGVSQIILDFNKENKTWDVVSFDRMWEEMGSWGALDKEQVKLSRVAKNEYVLSRERHDSGLGTYYSYHVFYTDSGDELVIKSSGTNAGDWSEEYPQHFDYDTEVIIDAKAETLTFHKTGTDYGGSGEPAIPVDETMVYKVIDGKFVKQ